MRTGLATILATALAALALLVVPAMASAATGPWTTSAWTGCGGGFSSGDTDDAGRLYIPCGNPTTVGIYDASGELVDAVPLGFWASDIAPLADGSAFYTASGEGPTHRVTRTPAGSWATDTSWAPQPYSMWGTTFSPKGHFVTVDGDNNLYLSDGAWSSNATHTVIKYAPDGHVITRFAQYVDHSWVPGDVYWMLTGLDVTRDGSRVYTTEVGDNRVQVWTRQGSGAYAVTGGWGGTAANNADRGGYCNWNGWQGAFAAPYDVQLDGDGDVYVINTTCKQVLEFDPDGAYLRQADVHLDGGDYPRPHGFAVARDGRVYVGENSKVLRPAGQVVPAHALPPSAYGGIVSWPVTTPATPTPTPPANGSTGSGRSGTVDRVAPRVEVRWIALPIAGRTSSAIVRVRCSEACTAAVTVRIDGTTARGTASVRCAAAIWCVRRVRVVQPAAGRRAAALRHGRARAAVAASDAAGNVGRAIRSASMQA